MKTRKLTPEEIATLKMAYCRRIRLRPKEFLFFFGISFLLSVPFVILFVLVSRFGHGDTWVQAAYNSSYAFAVGPGVLATILLVIGIRSVFSTESGEAAKIRSEIAGGVCRTTSHKVRRIWELVDEGNEELPDYLAELDTGFAVAIPREYLEEPIDTRESLELGALPKSGITVGVRFHGALLRACGRIVTDNIWRNDGLPYLTPIAPKDLPPEVVSAFGK